MKGNKKMRHKWFWAILVCLMVSPAMAQTPQGEFTFKLTGPDLDLISKGLGTQPYVDVVPLMQKMQKQYIDQQPKPVVKTPDNEINPPQMDAEGKLLKSK